MSPTTAVAAL